MLILSGLFNLDKKILTVLCYHSISDRKDRYSISESNFKKQITKISQNARFISIDEAVDVFSGKKINNPAVVLTIDDGFKDAKKVLPFLKKNKIPAALFVLAEPENANRKELDNDASMFSFSELKSLHKAGWIIGCHSATHMDFSSLKRNEIKREVVNSKRVLEKNLSFKVNYFAYPKGRYSNEIINAVKRAGYKAAFSIDPGSVSENSNKWRLPRLIIDRTHDLSVFPGIYTLPAMLLRRLIDILGIWRFIGI